MWGGSSSVAARFQRACASRHVGNVPPHCSTTPEAGFVRQCLAGEFGLGHSCFLSDEGERSTERNPVMIRVIGKWALLAALVSTGAAWGQSNPPSGEATSLAGRVVTLQQNGGIAEECRVLKTWTTPAGSAAFLLQSLDSDEKITVVQAGASKPQATEVATLIYRWGNSSTAPEGALLLVEPARSGPPGSPAVPAVRQASFVTQQPKVQPAPPPVVSAPVASAPPALGRPPRARRSCSMWPGAARRRASTSLMSISTRSHRPFSSIRVTPSRPVLPTAGRATATTPRSGIPGRVARRRRRRPRQRGS